MANYPHIKLNVNKQHEPTIEHKFNYGGGKKEDEDKETDYLPMVESFRQSLKQYRKDITKRIEERNVDLYLPAHIDYIQVEFQDQFQIDHFFQSWYNDFGVEGVRFTKFNRAGLFAVINREKFSSFLKEIEKFIIRESGEDNNLTYENRIKFIKEFTLLTTSDILTYQELSSVIFFNLINFPLGTEDEGLIFDKLTEYLTENDLQFRFNAISKIIEVENIDQATIEEIAKNFDIIHSVTSSLSTVVHPNELNLVEKEYGFTISNSEENLPVIGILDTGISNHTPLDPIIIKDDRFNITNESPFIDVANNEMGHGTSVAALAAMGKRPYSVNYRGEIQADAKLLSMKILEGDNGGLSIIKILKMLNEAKEHYPDIKIFVLAICFKQCKKDNEPHSVYAYELDKFAHENDCLIFICTANNNQAADHNTDYVFNYFAEERTNLCSPAESMNNIIIGAASDNLNNGIYYGISGGREWPALYTRTGHINLEGILSITKQNKNLFRPDVVASGGDYEKSTHFIAEGEQAVMELLSADPTRSFYKGLGTSFSTPLVANIAAQIQKKYSKLKSQTIKALIINAASRDLIKVDKSLNNLLNRSAGHGLANSEKSLNSTENSITFVMEDEILPGNMKIIPLNFPRYLIEENLGKKRGLLQLKATLCFSFQPVHENHLAYCPIHMGFSIFRNHSGEQITMKESDIKSKLKQGWSQNNRWKSKPTPASNTQKIYFPINLQDLENENLTFKLAIHCLINTQIIANNEYKNTSHPFSMALTIEETLKEPQLTGKLYNEMIAINEVENIITIEGEAEADLDY